MSSIFYRAMAIVFIVIAVIGFAPTFYLRGYLPLPPGFAPLTPLIVIHGLVATLWLLLFAAQTFLVARGQIALHRALGMAGAVLAIAMVVLAVLASLNGFRRGAALNGVDPRVWWLSVTLPGAVIFGGLVVAAFAFRRRPHVHKRLMLIATINVTTPAVARFVIRTFGADMSLPLGLIGTALLLAAVAIHDLWTTRRVHPAVIAGTAATLLVPVIAPPIAATRPALAFADFFK